MSTSKRLLWLNGFAIISVALFHASSYTIQAMFEWTNRYLPVEVPNFDLIGSPAYYMVMFIRLILTVAGPAFFVISGYFLGVFVKGSQATLSWESVFSRIRVLAVPFIVWTAIRYLLLRDFPRNIGDILKPYHWIPLLMQFYLVAPFLVRWAKRNWKVMLIAIGLFGWSQSFLTYAAVMGWPPAQQFDALAPNWLILVNFPFWVPFGIVMGLHYVEFKPRLFALRWRFLAAAVILGILVVVEYAFLDRLTGPEWMGPGFNGITQFPYYLFSMLAYLGFDKSRMPLAEQISQIGTKSLGIYLANIPSIYVVAVLMYRFAPQLLGIPLLYLAILSVVGLAVPLLLMEVVRRSPVRSMYRVLFG